MPTNPNDQVREQILRYFYDRNARARGIRGKTGAQIKISDVKRELKELHGLSQAQVISNLTYLLERGWVSHYGEKKTFTTDRGTAQPSTVDWYGISADGIDKIEGDSSTFTRRDPYAGVNITAVGSTVQVGDGNYVNARYSDLHTDLERLREALATSDALDDETKVAAIADIETVKGQLVKSEPDRGVLASLWPSVEKIATAAGLASNAAAVAARLGGLL